MECLTRGRLRAETPFPLTELTLFRTEQRENRHARAEFGGILDEAAGEETLRQSLSGRVVRFYDAEDEDAPIFAGYIEKAEVTAENGFFTLFATALSGSVILDRAKESRSYQDVTMLHEDALRRTLSPFPEADFILRAEDRPIGAPLVQYGETAWEFAKRLASRLGTTITPDAESGLPRFWLGLRKGRQTYSFDECEYTAALEEKYQEQGGSALGFSRSDFMSYTVRSGKNAALGGETEFKGQPLRICRKSCVMDEGMLFYGYTLGRETLLAHRKYYNDGLTGRGIKGRVIATQGGTVKLHLDIDEAQDVESAYPYRWAPPTGNFMYLLPKLGSEAILYFPDPGEENAKAINCVRTEASRRSEGMANPSRRGLHTEHGKRLMLYPDSFGFESDTGGGPLRFAAEDDKGISIETAHGLTIAAGGRIRIEAPVIEVKSPERVEISRTAGSGEALVPVSILEAVTGRTDVFSERGRCVMTGFEAAEYEMPEAVKEPFSVKKLFGNVVKGLAVVCGAVFIASLFPIAAPLLAMGAIAGALSVGAVAVSDAMSGEVSDATVYAREAVFGTVEGLVAGAAGLALRGVKIATRAGRFLLKAAEEAAEGAVWSGTDNLLRAGFTEEKFDVGELKNALLRGSVSGMIGGGAGRTPGLNALSKQILKAKSPAANALLVSTLGAAAGGGVNYGAQLADMALFDEEGNFNPDTGRIDAKAVDWTQVGISAGMGALASRASVTPNKPVTPTDGSKTARVTANAGGAGDASGKVEAGAKIAAEGSERIDGIVSTKGYSDFADGMSPDDAARYIASNETKFYAEFSERAQANGLNGTLISEAYNAMRAGDYTKMASYFDTSSPHNGAVFWSGDKTEAGGYARSISGTILEQTQGGRVFDDWRGLRGMYPEWNTKGAGALNQRPIWEALSSQYANGATGYVTFVHPSTYTGQMWEKVESKIIDSRIKMGFVDGIKEVYVGGTR
ncbi:MAG: hypothetical protein LBP73_03910 [Clostridiales Family XIII bacterium]|jgi:hypothetical protein|nr:hypothetical protein [Clostridiales Family XIII bacterium]